MCDPTAAVKRKGITCLSCVTLSTFKCSQQPESKLSNCFGQIRVLHEDVDKYSKQSAKRPNCRAAKLSIAVLLSGPGASILLAASLCIPNTNRFACISGGVSRLLTRLLCVSPFFFVFCVAGVEKQQGATRRDSDFS